MPMKPEFFTRGPQSPRHVLLRRHGVAIGPTQVNEEHLERIRIARRRLGIGETVSQDNHNARWETAVHFAEPLCVIGGCMCPAWDEWFQGCINADSDSVEEERDPELLTEWPFNPLACERPDICQLYKNASGLRAHSYTNEGESDAAA